MRFFIYLDTVWVDTYRVVLSMKISTQNKKNLIYTTKMVCINHTHIYIICIDNY